MLRKKNKKVDENDYMYMEALKNKKISLLVLDSKWHELFPVERKTDEIKNCEKKLNELLKKQGRNTNNIKEYENAKKAIMSNIVHNMTDGSGPDSFLKAKKQEKNQKLMADLNNKLSKAEEIQKELPVQIEIANNELLIEGMKLCYAELASNTEKIEALEEWIKEARDILKNKILEKQDMEMRNTELYTYMHNLLGAQVVEVFDKNHRIWKGNIEENKNGDI